MLLVTTLILLAAHTILPGQRYLVVTSLPAGEYVVGGCGQTSHVRAGESQGAGATDIRAALVGPAARPANAALRPSRSRRSVRASPSSGPN